MTAEDRHIRELIILKTIAEALNESNGLSKVLDLVIGKLLELTGLTAGWLFLVDESGHYEFAADRNLPPALRRKDKEPMRCGSCWCLDRYGDGRLKNAVNILNCKRLENAVSCDWGDTGGITHHATVPLRSGSRRFGVLNVAAPGKTRFTDEELALLQAVALQLGSAIERMRLYAAEQRRADLFARLGEYSSAFGSSAAEANDRTQLAEQAMRLIGVHFDWPYAALLEPAGEELTVRALYREGRTTLPYALFPRVELGRTRHKAGTLCPSLIGGEGAARLASLLAERELMPPLVRAAAATVPSSGSGALGVLLVGCDKPGETYRADEGVIEALAEHIGVALERFGLEENRRELARMEERNRLARDLHDSVSQTLFSLVMMAKGAGSLLPSELSAGALDSAVKDMQTLSQSALKEMRELIMQLRPAGLEEGLAAGLRRYGERLNLRVRMSVSGMRELPRAAEETLWRIGQEALNNVSKHAGSGEASVTLLLNEREAVLRVEDRGQGITKRRLSELTRHSIGLSSMRERAEAHGGRFTLRSAHRSGTMIEAALPLRKGE